MEIVCVIVAKDGVVDESFAFVGKNEVIARLAEAKMVSLLSTLVSNWDEHSPEDVEAITEDGYYEFGTGSVCITWPEVEAENRADAIFQEAVDGLKEYYPVLEQPDIVAKIKAEVKVPDSGNDFNDYLSTKDQVEIQAENGEFSEP